MSAVQSETLRPIARYKIGYATDDWGTRSSTPSGIPDHAGAWVRYEDHLAALVEAQQPATHVQNPAEIAHVAGDVSKNGAESNMAQRPAPSAAAALPEGWVPLVITHEGQYPEEVAYGPQILMDRLGKWLRKYFDHVVASKAQPAPTPQADSQPAAVRRESAAPKLRAMAINYPEGASWDKLDAQTCMEGALEIEALRAARAPADSVTAPAGVAIAAHRVMRKRLDGEWVCDARYWCDGPPSKELVESICADKDRWRVDVAYTSPPTQAADSVLEDADPIRALIAEHAAILDQNESAYFELCYHRATGWMAWITDKPLCMPPVVNQGRKVLAQGQGDTADEACRDAARKQGANHE